MSQTGDVRADEFTQQPQDAEEAIEGLPSGFGTGLTGTAAYTIAIVFALFELWTAAYGMLRSQVVRGMHVAFRLLVRSARRVDLGARTSVSRSFFWALGVAGFLTGVYNWGLYVDIRRRTGFLPTPALLVGTV